MLHLSFISVTKHSHNLPVDEDPNPKRQKVDVLEVFEIKCREALLRVDYIRNVPLNLAEELSKLYATVLFYHLIHELHLTYSRLLLLLPRITFF